MSSAGPSDAVGKTCPYCMSKIEPGVAVVVCPQCGIPHHADCWRENGRCTTFGCQGGGPQITTTGPVQGDARYVENRPCPHCGFMMRPYETVCPYCRTSLLAPRPTPSRYGQGAYPQYARPHRAGTVLAYGILSIVCCALFGVAAWAMANEDLAAMNAGLMEESGRATTEVGRILGIVGLLLQSIALFTSLLGGLANQ